LAFDSASFLSVKSLLTLALRLLPLSSYCRPETAEDFKLLPLLRLLSGKFLRDIQSCSRLKAENPDLQESRLREKRRYSQQKRGREADSTERKPQGEQI